MSDQGRSDLGVRGHGHLSLTREETCVRALAWRCDLPSETPWQALLLQLENAGFVRQPPLGTLERVLTPERHELLFVTHSGRVQLRVHYSTPSAERRHVAERLLVGLVHALRRIRNEPVPGRDTG